MSANTFLGGVRSDFALLFASVFLCIFAGIIVYAMTQVEIAGEIQVETLMVAFMGIVVAIIGFLGITKGRAETKDSSTI